MKRILLFLMSKIKTVFYSTNANQDTNGNPSTHLGYMGVSNLTSGWIDDQHKNAGDDYTQGTGYFSADDSNDAIQGTLNLDPSWRKRESERNRSGLFTQDRYVASQIRPPCQNKR